MLGKRQSNGSVWHSRAIGYLAHGEVITDEQGLFHGWCWYTVVLEEKDVYQSYCYYGEDESIKPLNHSAVFTVAFFPESPVDLLADIYVKNHG